LSIQVIQWAFQQKTENSGMKVLLLALANHADDQGGNCWPSQSTLARETDMTPRAVRLNLNKLESAGLIKHEQRIQHNRFISNTYVIAVRQLFPNQSNTEVIAVRKLTSAGTEIISKSLKEKESTKEKEKKTNRPRTVLKPRVEKQPRPIDPAYELFVEVFADLRSPAKYQSTAADFVQLAALRKAQGIEARASPPDWLQACRNYCASPLGSFSFADLCRRYAVFVRSGVNEYGKPIGAKSGSVATDFARQEPTPEFLAECERDIAALKAGMA
jgi:hypothetical protein